MANSVYVWDRPDVPLDKSNDILLWQSYASKDTLCSIPCYVDEHGERLRAKYLAFIHDLGESQINAKRVVDHLDNGDGFSFWWMTQLAEKSPFKSPRIFDCLRLLALEEILLERRPSSLTLVSSDLVLSNAMRVLCNNLRINYFWQAGEKLPQKFSLRSLYDKLPFFAQGLIALVRHIALRWSLRKLQKPEWFSGKNTVFFCSYLFNLDVDSCNDGRFYAWQWEELPQYLQNSGKQTNWIHHLVLNAGAPSTNKGIDWLRRFNRDRGKQGCHAFLDTFLSSAVVWRAFKRWLWLNVTCWRLRKVSRAFTPNGSAVQMWPLMRQDWLTSMSGSVAINNCLWVELFDEVFSKMPHQETGLYLWENQGWESALLHAWMRHGHGRIIGVPHSTVVFWHLNNFDDARSLNSNKICAKPLPDQLAVNGPMAWEAFASTGYPVERLVEVEALRFQYLLKLNADKATFRDNKFKSENVSAKGGSKLLILGDFTFKQTVRMLKCVESASLLMNHDVSITLKPHPACRIDKDDYSALRFNLTDLPLAEIMCDFDYAFSSNVSSAGLDALLAGVPVVIFLEDNCFNHSPLRGIKGVKFARSGQNLADALQLIDLNASDHFSAGDFFWLDKKLPRWRNLLSMEKING